MDLEMIEKKENKTKQKKEKTKQNKFFLLIRI